MAKRVLPPWQRTVQRIFFVIAAVLCITLPVLYGKHRSISSGTMGWIFGVFFGLWIWFTAFTYCRPRPTNTESSLPIHTPSPLILHTPTRSDALPSSPAIRLPKAAHTATPKSTEVEVDEKHPQRGARFALDIEDEEENPRSARAQNSVSFKTRPRGNTTDSASSLAYPTFAAYRQAQHVNFDTFAQRVKRAFALKQDQEREEKATLQQRQQEEEETALRIQKQEEQVQQLQQQMVLRPSNPRSQSSSVLGKSEMFTNNSGTRSRSSSAAGMIGEFAERIKNGSSIFFRRSSSSFGIVTSNDHDDAGSGGRGSDSNLETKVQTTFATKTNNKNASYIEDVSAGIHPVTGYQDYVTIGATTTTTADLPTVVILPSSPVFPSEEGEKYRQ